MSKKVFKIIDKSFLPCGISQQLIGTPPTTLSQSLYDDKPQQAN